MKFGKVFTQLEKSATQLCKQILEYEPDTVNFIIEHIGEDWMLYVSYDDTDSHNYLNTDIDLVYGHGHTISEAVEKLQLTIDNYLGVGTLSNKKERANQLKEQINELVAELAEIEK